MNSKKTDNNSKATVYREIFNSEKKFLKRKAELEKLGKPLSASKIPSRKSRSKYVWCIIYKVYS